MIQMLVSIIMPAYNCGKYLGQAIESVASQTMKDWEIQLVDDCSTDNTSSDADGRGSDMHHYLYQKIS